MFSDQLDLPKFISEH